MSSYINEELELAECVEDVLNSDRIYDITEAVIDYCEIDVFSATLKAMLTARHYSCYAHSKADRDIHHADFLVFSKAFANECLTAIEKSIGEI